MWNFFEPKDAQWYRWKLDGASLWMYKEGEEWRFALNSLPFKHLQSDSDGPEPVEPLEGVSVSIAVAGGKKAALHPHPSPIPYLVSARNDVKIHPGTEAWFTIALPPVLRVELESGYVLYEGSPFTTPSTWFGDKTSGNLCLSLPIELDPASKNGQGAADGADGTAKAASPASLSMQESMRRAAQYLACKSLIHCRIIVKNRSKEPLDVKRLAIFTDLMNVYEKEDTLVSDTVVITGTADGSLQTNIEDMDFKGLHKIHTASKTGLNELLIRRGVSFLRSIAGL
jgi:hypothetical protein